MAVRSDPPAPLPVALVLSAADGAPTRALPEHHAAGEGMWATDDSAARQRIGADYAEMMARYLGPVVMTAIADDDVTEVYVNPQDGRLRLDTHRAGRVDTTHVVPAARLEMFL
ncbi:MAG: hypothetical protein MUF00_21525, partial [Gemmatimonadaceae bacterium]|nr:hypothetical protein [Gemmatimonadaceae bacterium]